MNNTSLKNNIEKKHASSTGILNPGEQIVRNRDIPPTPIVDNSIILRIENRSPTQPNAIVPRIITSPCIEYK